MNSVLPFYSSSPNDRTFLAESMDDCDFYSCISKVSTSRNKVHFSSPGSNSAAPFLNNPISNNKDWVLKELDLAIGAGYTNVYAIVDKDLIVGRTYNHPAFVIVTDACDLESTILLYRFDFLIDIENSFIADQISFDDLKVLNNVALSNAYKLGFVKESESAICCPSISDKEIRSFFSSCRNDDNCHMYFLDAKGRFSLFEFSLFSANVSTISPNDQKIISREISFFCDSIITNYSDTIVDGCVQNVVEKWDDDSISQLADECQKQSTNISVRKSFFSKVNGHDFSHFLRCSNQIMEKQFGKNGLEAVLRKKAANYDPSFSWLSGSCILTNIVAATR